MKFIICTAAVVTIALSSLVVVLGIQHSVPSILEPTDVPAWHIAR
jgi:hypothetical protein